MVELINYGGLIS